MYEQSDSYPLAARLIHLGLAVFGISAFLTGELAEEGARTGYLIHAYLGLSLSAILLSRVIAGLGGSSSLSFANWRLLGRESRALIKADLRDLAALRLPAGKSHSGLAGLVQALGLQLFSLMGLTGAGLFF